MRLLGRVTDRIVSRLAPKAVGRAGGDVCQFWVSCGPCSGHSMNCTYHYSNCQTETHCSRC